MSHRLPPTLSLSHLASLLPYPLITLSTLLHSPSSPTPSVDYRLLRRWVKGGKGGGGRPIPDWVWGEMRRLLVEHEVEVCKVVCELEERAI